MTDVQTTITVSSAAQLMTALSKATGGETILLAPGNYGELNLYDQRETFASFAGEVTIKSADPNNMASFGRMSLRGVENLTFDSIKFDYDAAPGTPDYDKPFLIRDCDFITIRNSIFEGDLAEGLTSELNGQPTGHGLSVTDGSSNITVENNTFYNWLRGATFSGVSGIDLIGNEVYNLRGDGFNFAAVTDVLIEGNYLHDFHRVNGFHMDMIQFWTNGTTTPTTDVIIRGNILDSGAGSDTQSIFMRNEEVDTGAAGLEMYYKNILIEDNVIHNAHTHGITVGETVGLTIKNNTILHNSDTANDGLSSIPTINIKDVSQNVVIANNILPRLSIVPGVGRVVENNLVAQCDSPDGANYVGDLFVDGLAGSRATLDDLRAVVGGLVDQLNVGSSLTRFDTTPDSPTGFITDNSGSGFDLLTHSLNASAIFGPAGAMNLTGAKVVWNFGDGTASGAGSTIVSHTWLKAGSYDVTAVVTLANGQTVSLGKTIEVQTPLVIDADFDNRATDLSDICNNVVVGSLVKFEGTGDNLAMRLNGGKVAYARSPDLINNSEYTMVVDFKKDAGKETLGGTLVYFSSSFVVNIGADGLNVSVSTNKGSTWMKPTAIGINDSDWHRLALTFSGADGAAILYVDGVEVARLSGLTGAVQTGSALHDLYLGHPSTATSSFPGLIDNFQFWRGAMSGEEVRDISTRAADGRFAPLDDSPPAPPVVLPPVDPYAFDFSNVVFAQTLTGSDGADSLSGGGAADYILGLLGSDALRGRNGNDVMCGGGGSDELIGGGGNDLLIGGLGADLMTGGTGNDVFAYKEVSESSVGSGRDRITDFTQGQDKIDLSRIDAIAGGGNDAFTFIGMKAFSAAGQLRQVDLGRSGIMVEGDVNGDGKADFQIAIQIPKLILTANDFDQ